MKHTMAIQWHITTECQNRCKHCYVFDPATYERERACGLSLSDKLRVLDQFDAFGEKWGINFASVTLMGGDPLLAPDWYAFAREIRSRGKQLSIGGNPEMLTDENLARLKELGVRGYQLSLDGMETTHDAQRRPGSFQNTLEGIERLAAAGIYASVMGTLTPLNAKEFWQLADFVFFKTRSRGFAFDFVARVGNARGFEKALTPEEALALSERYLDMKQARYAQRPEFSFAEKPGLFRLLRVKRGDYAHYDDGETYPAAGCLIANNCLNVLSDGTMLACRRFPQIVGRLPQDDLEQILLRSPILKKYRRPQFWKACGNCMAWGYCRGCPAVSFGESGDPFAPLPYCYAHLLGFDAFRAHAPIPMETTDEEEAELIKRNLMQTYARGVAAGQINPDFSKQLLAFCADPEQERAFVRSPEAWFAAHRPEWEAADRRLFTARFNQFRAAESAPSVSG